MRLRSALALMAVPMLAACASSNTVPDSRPPDLPPSIRPTATGAEVRVSNPDEGVTTDLPVPVDRVYAALVEAYKDFNFEPDIVDTRTHQLGVQRLTRSQLAGERADALARCANEGAGPSAASRMRITFAFVSRVMRDGDGSILNTRVTAHASPVDGSSIGNVGCVSTGRLEQRILAGVALKLGMQPPRSR